MFVIRAPVRSRNCFGIRPAMRDGYETTWLKPLGKQVNALNDSAGKPAVRIVPVGRAVFALRERVVQGTAPGIAKQSDLFRDDLAIRSRRWPRW